MSNKDFFSNISYLMLELNSQCNLRCIHCTRENMVKAGLRAPKFMSEADLKYLLEQIKDCPVDTIKIEGLSVPMMFPEFADRAQLIRNQFPQAHIIVITNLQYEPSKTSFFKTAALSDSLYFSVDGTGEIYEKIRAGARWNRFLKSLEQISENTDAATRKKMHLNFTATPENYLELPEIYKLRDKFELGSVRINLVQNWDENSPNAHSFSRDQLDFLKTYQADIKGVGGWDYKNCFWVFNGVVIDVEGNVRQCVINTTQEPLGNVFQTPLREIFNTSPRLQESRRLLGQNQAAKQCRFCDYKNMSSTLNYLFEGLTLKNTARAVVK